MKTVKFFISGYVQGVGYRKWLRHQATQLGLTGWVKNCTDGTTVEALVCGEKGLIVDLLRRMKTGGPILAKIERITEVHIPDPIPPYTAFSVLQ